MGGSGLGAAGGTEVKLDDLEAFVVVVLETVSGLVVVMDDIKEAIARLRIGAGWTNSRAI